MFRILLLFSFLLIIQQFRPVHAQEPPVLSQPLTIRFQNDSLSRVMLRLQSRTKVPFAFDPAIFMGLKPVNQVFVAVPLEDILKNVLFGTGLGYEIYGNQVVIKKKINAVTIDGHLRDKSSGEELIGANIFVPQLNTGVITNQYGFYSLTLPEGDYVIHISHIGYQTETRTVHLDKAQTLEIGLTQKTNDLKEIAIDTKSLLHPLGPNYETNLLPDNIKELPYYAGEEDVIKALQMQHGIKAMTEGSSGLFIRGGNMDQNLIMLDEAMIYNPSHLFGLVSIFNPDAMKNVQVYRDYMPAAFGGRLSSVIDNRMAEGNNKEFHVKGGVSLLSARLAVEGPTVKEKGSFLVSFRRSLLDLFDYRFRLANHQSTYYDFNFKTNYQVNNRNRILYSFYFGDDYLNSKNSYSNKWGNLASTLRWNHIFSSRLFLNVSAIYSNYINLLDVNADTLSEKYQWKTGVKDIGLKGDFSYYQSRFNNIKFGLAGTWHRFIPGEATNAFPGEFNISRDQSFDYAAYISQQLTIRNVLELNYGIRATLFRTTEDLDDVFDGQGNKLNAKDISQYVGLEPRINVAWLFPQGRAHLTYNHNRQFIQLIQSTELAFSSLETWLPSSSLLKPQRSDHWSAGFEYRPAEGYSGSVDFYYKRMYNQQELGEHVQIIQNPSVRQALLKGVSDAYGMEFNFKKNLGRFTGDLSYVYSRAFRKIMQINEGKRFAANFDIPHEVKLQVEYKATDRIALGSFYTYATGRPLTLPVGYYWHDNVQVPIFEGRNTSRYPDFYRLDLSARYFTGSPDKSKKTFSSVVSVGVYNVFNRKNPLFYRLRQMNSTADIPQIEYASGILPWISYNFRI
ncbi:TonB-dependent receptor plug domain-containing protein (plasmid) [Pedobacter sp. BS3]|nr:TonB-dependent receptor plug domain-containing protein [Pedobacter sp. BS3]